MFGENISRESISLEPDLNLDELPQDEKSNWIYSKDMIDTFSKRKAQRLKIEKKKARVCALLEIL